MFSRAAFCVHKLSSMSMNIVSKAKHPSNNLSTMSPQRLYSQKPQERQLDVDYDYVKQATENKQIVIIDVREPEEIKEHGKIPNSVNIPLGDVPSSLSNMSDKEFQKVYGVPKPAQDAEIIFYCMIGKRSGKAQQNALNLGFLNVKNYVGSWTDWSSKN